MAVGAQPLRREAPDAGVIDDARARQQRGRIAGISLAALIAGIAIAGGGSGGDHHRGSQAPLGSSPYVSVGSGINVRSPHGWHLFHPPITSLVYPYDRMLLTSYPATTGGECGPTRAESVLPAGGALIYLSEYGATPGVFGEPRGMEFPPQSAGFKLQRANLGNYECSAVPSYLLRFRAAGRLFQVSLAFGAHATASRRAQATHILSDLQIQPITSAK